MFERTRNQIITAALLKCRVGAAGEDVQAEEMLVGTRELNTIIKFWQTQGFHIWKLPEAVLFLRKGQSTYQLGTDEVYCSSEIKETNLKFQAYKEQNEIYLNNLPSVGDKIGITLVSGDIFFTEVTNVGEYVTLKDGLPDDACECGKVYYYSKRTGKPLKILQARRECDGSQIPMNFLEQEQFFKLVGNDEGAPLNYSYMPKIDVGELKVWHTPSNDHTLMRFIYEQEFDIFENSKDLPDIPAEWIEPLTWELAYKLSANYGLGLEERNWLKEQAKEALEQAKRFDQETGSFYLQLAQDRGAF